MSAERTKVGRVQGGFRFSGNSIPGSVGNEQRLDAGIRCPIPRLYDLPKIDPGKLVGVVVEVTLPIGATGSAILVLPEEWGGTDKLYRYLSPIDATGGSIVTLSPTNVRSLASPAAALHCATSYPAPMTMNRTRRMRS